ncbi:perlucin-like protein isoform X2 [Dreissena polymorpha]|uniref:C-type lectin domain-containing protein n=1 Tax=Dreissena polymorpha TaxID=45954 RepID=A0A9D4LFY5_DREPO|nr:perlucin-like protein isoform X2 [Dreissena polymorpha]KAH3857917.1 hypothetical protein DPMN_100535 [Dreissena polymorpha]
MGVVFVTNIQVLSIVLSLMSKCDAQITGTCIRDYQMADTFCYKFYFNSRLTWNQADARCNQDGALLIKLESFTMLRKVKSIIQAKVPPPTPINQWHGGVWVGARNNSNGYVWTDGTRVSSDLWSEGEPNDQYENEDCALVDHRANHYLNDVLCDSKEAFICQDVEQSDPTATSHLPDMHSTSRQETHGNTNIVLIAASVTSVVVTVGLLAVALVVYICVMRRKQGSSASPHNRSTERSPTTCIERPPDQYSAYDLIVEDYQNDYIIPAHDDGYLTMTAGTHTATFNR